MMEKTVDTHSPKTAISVRFCQKRFASLVFTSCGEQVCSEASTQPKEKSHFLRFSFESFKGLRALFSVFDQSVAFIS